MLKEFHKLFQTRFPTHLCYFCTWCSLCFTRFNAFAFHPCCGTQKCYWLWLCRLACSGTWSGCCQLCDFLTLARDETHKGDAAAGSVSAVNPPSVSRNKCAPSLPPRAAPADGYTGDSGPLIQAPTSFACTCRTLCMCEVRERCVILQGVTAFSALLPFCSVPL